MKNKFIYASLLISLIFTSKIGLYAQSEPLKQTLKTNGQVTYNIRPSSINEFNSMLSEGVFYGRIRSNSFYLDYKTDDDTHFEHFSSGLGGSIIFKSASLSNFDFSAGLYYSQAYFWNTEDDVGNLKKGKDVISRFDYVNTDKSSMGVLGQAYIHYNGISDIDVTLGRQLIESFYTASNDTKMIPNTFDALVVGTKVIPKTKIKIGYLYKQKLRDHTQPHSLLMYGDSNSTSAKKQQWSENDDSAMHKGLTYTALKEAGKPTDAPLIIADVKNTAIKNLNLDASFYLVPQLLSQAMIEFNYKFAFDGYSVTPAFRYIKQLDNGAGEVGGAAYSGDTTGYKNPDSLKAQMLALRVVTKIKNYKINLGYTNILDEADLITPWRGFPTSGYTRSMARYNWRANTKSYRLEIVQNANNVGIYNNRFVQSSILYVDADESKNEKDYIYYYLGFVQNVASLPNMQWRLRLGYVSYVDSNDSDYNDLDSRFEINYLF